MSEHYDPANEPQIQPRNPYARPNAIPDIQIEGLLQKRTPVLVPREASTTTGVIVGTISCGPKDTTGPCARSTSATQNTTIPIVLGVVLPLGVALIVMIILHRRHVRKLRREDADDKHKSLDFGLGDDGHGQKKMPKGKYMPEMTMIDPITGRRNRGLSMDLTMGNPYLLPPELHQSRESLHSLSRSIHNGDDKYRTTDFIPDDGSIRSPSIMKDRLDDSSSFTGSSRRRFETDSNRNLLRNAQGMPIDPLSRTNSEDDHMVPQKSNNLLAPNAFDDTRESFVSTTSSNGVGQGFRANNSYLGGSIDGGAKIPINEEDKVIASSTTEQIQEPEKILPPPPAVVKDDHSRPASDANSWRRLSRDSEILKSKNLTEKAPKLPQLGPIENEPPFAPEISVTEPQSPRKDSLKPEPRSTAAVHPESKEQPRESYQDGIAQNREVQDRDTHDFIDSYNRDERDSYQLPPNPNGHQSGNYPIETEDDYYDEEEEDLYSIYNYEDDIGYDPRRLTMGMRPLPPDDPTENPEQRANRIRSFYKEYFDESNKTPNLAQKVEYFDGSENYDEGFGSQGYYDRPAYYHPRGTSMGGQSEIRHRANTFSNGSYMAGPRAYSSASGRLGPGRMPQPKKKLPPPKPLNVLPTPHMIKDDTFMTLDYAPPQMVVAQRSGTPNSLRGGMRPYSPTVRPHVPLASSFDDLAVIPSPHALRKSGTFTALDFAPPRMRGMGDTASDAGSIRSNRSGMSAMHLHNIRTGAYRVSRIPKEVAGTKDEITASLRPQWNMNR